MNQVLKIIELALSQPYPILRLTLFLMSIAVLYTLIKDTIFLINEIVLGFIIWHLILRRKYTGFNFLYIIFMKCYSVALTIKYVAPFLIRSYY